MPFPVTHESYHGLSRPQEDNTGTPSKQHQSSGNNSSSPVHHVLALHASGHFSCPISNRFFFSAYNTEHVYEETLEALPG